MFKNFLPPETAELTESTSIALAESIEQVQVPTSLSKQPIATTYVNQGSSGTPILLLHGFDSSVFEFRRLLPLLAAENETWAVDLLGFGFTERLPEIAFSPAAIKTHLYYFWKTVIAQPVILIGASMGGAAAIDFVLDYPESVEQLILLDSAGYSAGMPVGKFLFWPFDALAVEFLRIPKVREQISKAAYVNQNLVTPDATLCASLHLKLPGWHQALKAFTKSGGYGSFQAKLGQIQQPTVILWGKNDQILGTDDGYKFQDAIASSQLIWIEDCGHVPHLEQPQATAKHILELGVRC
ncbi:MAG: alpha/beta hydrolase [Symploca sp. SIO1B1]|nr:alpha/beta hydrolase [Symploca sp. SIO1B1]